MSDDFFNGGTGTDTVTFAGIAAGYRIDMLDDGRIQVVDIDFKDGDTGTDTLTGIDRLQFTDRLYNLSREALLPDGEMQINDFAIGDQSTPAITALSDGGYLITWISQGQDGSGYGIYAQRFDANGNHVGSETRINANTTNNQISPSITVLAKGEYVVTWSSLTKESGYDIFMQRFDAEGKAVGEETQVNSYTNKDQQDSKVTAFADGGCLVTWTSYDQDGSGSAIYARRYDAEGKAIGDEARINSHTLSDQFDPAVAVLSDGSYVITWTSDAQDGSGLGIYAQRFDEKGGLIGIETKINSYATNHQQTPAIAALTDGGHVITWHSNNNIYIKVFDKGGGPLTEDQVTIRAHYHGQPEATALADGGFVITWTKQQQSDESKDIYIRHFDAKGDFTSDELLVNTFIASEQTLPDTTALADGGYVVTWVSQGQDGSGLGIYAQRFDAEGKAYTSSRLEITGTGTHDTLNAGSGDQILKGLAGNDFLSGGTGIDVLIGGAGGDTYTVDQGDAIVELSGGGTDTVRTGFSYTLANHLENLVLTGKASISGTGNSAANRITGNSGSNTLNGGGGADMLEGGLGDDVYVLDDYEAAEQPHLTDSIFEAADGGIDSVTSVISHTLATNIEVLTLVGVDAINGIGNSLANTVTGNGAANRLFGHDGNDVLVGGRGADFLSGGEGRDSLSGGGGTDIFLFQDSFTRVDMLKDFSVADDTIQLENAIFTSLATTGALNAANFAANVSGIAMDSNDYILYETDIGQLYYDADGNGAGARVLFALIGTSTHAALTATDFSVV